MHLCTGLVTGLVTGLILGNLKLWFNYMNKKIGSKSKFWLVLGRFSISSWRGKGHEPSRAELKILQLELWLEPARLGLITIIYASKFVTMVEEKRFELKISFKISFLIHMYVTRN